MKKISIAIPTYEMGGKGVDVLSYSFYMISRQTFKDFDVVVADHSTDDKIMSLCKMWDNIFDIRYYRNKEDRGSAAANTNFAVEKSTGEWIKILCQDDYLFDKNSLQIIADNLVDDYAFSWLATGYWHTRNKHDLFIMHTPSLNDWLMIVNTIGTPSCVAVKNVKYLPKMDKNLTYAYDCEWYHELKFRYGTPLLIDEPTIVNYLHDNSISSGVSQDLIDRENDYILRKHGKKL
jgi:glycosyltransferase involved in cell wall biosynthesis